MRRKVITKGKIFIAVCALALGFYARSLASETAGNTTVGNRELPIYCVQTDEKKVAITFDAAWGNEDVDTLLDILARNEVRATFFVTGGWVDSYPDDLKKIADAGHVIGNHSQNHKHMSELGETEIKEELNQVKEKADAITGQNMKLFRPPYGDYNNTLINTAKAGGYYTIQWDVDSLDWKDYGADNIIKTVCEHKALGNGSIILMHNGAKYTKDALETVIKNLKEQGYIFVTVDELIYKDNFHMDANGRQHNDGEAKTQ